LCEHFGFYDPRGQKQRDGCVKALRELETDGWFILPVARRKTGPNSAKRLSEPVAAAEGVPAEAGDVGGLRLVVVGTDEQMRIWNEMMIGEHPRGAGPLVGR